MPGLNTGPLISVIVPAHNAEATIGVCVRSLQKHLPVGVEIIVVDNDSTDRTADIAREEGVEVVQAPGVFVSEVRNVGARRAERELLAFVDSDCTITEGWYEAILDLLGDDPEVGVTGCRHVIPDNPVWVEAVWFDAHQAGRTTSLQEVPYIPAGNLVVRKAVFDQVGGFDPSLETGEDPDLCQRIKMAGYKIVESARIRCVHLGEPKTLGDVFRRERWHGRGVRLRYATGRIAPVVVLTFMFLCMLLAGCAGLIAAIWSRTSVPLAALALPLFVPTLSAVLKGRGLAVGRIPLLSLVYLFYFLGRAASLPVAVMRQYENREDRPDEV